jgi:MFS family permease
MLAAMSAASEVWDRPRRGLTVGLLSTVAFTAFEALAVATILPTTVGEIGGLELYGWAFSAFMLASLIGISAGGASADRRGPAPAFAAGIGLFSIGLVGAGFATTMGALVATRFVQGLGSGAIGATSYVAVGRGYPASARPRMIALLSSAWVIPGLVGPALAGLVTDVFGWRWVFFGLAPATLLGAALALPGLARLVLDDGEERAGSDRTPVRDSVELALGATLVLLGFEAPGAAALATLAAGTALGIRAARRLLPPGTLLARPGPAAAVALVGVVGFAFFGAEAFVPLAIDVLREQPATVAGLPLTVGTLTWSLGAWVQAREAPRRSRRMLVALGFGLISVGILITATIVDPRTPLLLAGVGWGLTSLGMGITYSTLTLVILEGADPGEEGRASAALQLAYTLCIALGTGLGGGLLALAERMDQPLSTSIGGIEALMAAIALGAAWLARRLPDRKPAAS